MKNRIIKTNTNLKNNVEIAVIQDLKKSITIYGNLSTDIEQLKYTNFF